MGPTAARLVRQIQRLGGEQITYTPAGGTPRTVWAIVERAPAAKHYAAASTAQPRVALTVVNDATLGIDTATYDGGGSSKVSLALRVGAGAEELSITGEPVSQDDGMATFFIR